MKKIYSSPIMVIEPFEPQSYCATCEIEADNDLYALCVGSEVQVKIAHVNSTGDGYQGLGDGDMGSSGVLYNAGGDNWVFTGAIRTGHSYDKVNGEYWPMDAAVMGQKKADGSSYAVGDTYNGYILCDHHFAVSASHHHLTHGRIIGKNHS